MQGYKNIEIFTMILEEMCVCVCVYIYIYLVLAALFIVIGSWRQSGNQLWKRLLNVVAVHQRMVCSTQNQWTRPTLSHQQ